MFLICWGEVSADSDGPVEMCKPVPEREAPLAEQYPELTLRTEPAYQEAFVALPADPGGTAMAVHWRLAMESLNAWVQEQEQLHKGERLALEPAALGVRLTYLWTEPVTQTTGPDCNFAIPFVVER